jgi:hypothetical protein
MIAISGTSRIARRTRRAISTLAQLTGAIAIELRRLNSARIDSSTLASMPPRDRRNAVKAALADHHSNNPRCC